MVRSAYLELLVVCQDGLCEFRQHVAGAGRKVDVSGAQMMLGSRVYLRQLTRTPFFAHSTASEAAICLTAARHVR